MPEVIDIKILQFHKSILRNAVQSSLKSNDRTKIMGQRDRNEPLFIFDNTK
jgi:hypothetical protein